MKGILADVNVRGHVQLLLFLFRQADWDEIWASLNCQVLGFGDVGLADEAPDSLIWQTCQDEELVLITGNRNKEGPDSLQVSIETRNLPNCLPVITLANADRILIDRKYANLVAERLLERLLEMELLLGTGRLYVP